MHFANTEKGHGKVIKVCSFVLAMLIMVSMLFVGQVGEVDANAATKDKRIYVSMGRSDGGDNTWWFDGGAKSGIWASNDSGSGKSYILHNLAGHVYYFEPDFEITKFQVFRYNQAFTLQDGITVYNNMFEEGTITWTGGKSYINGTRVIYNQKDDVSTSGYSDSNNCYYFKGSRSKWASFTLPSNVGQSPTPTTHATAETISAHNGFGEGTAEVPLVAVPATFYDYYTDYEVEHGWRSVLTANDKETLASRTCNQSFPYSALNKYISNLAKTNDWKLPLYFGNFFTGRSLYYESDEILVAFGDTAFDWLDGNNYNKTYLKNFSSQANNSMFMKDSDAWIKGSTVAQQDGSGNVIGYSDASKSYLALADSTLKNNTTLTFNKGNLEAPYFSDDIVKAGLATKISSDFPMRVVSTNSNKFLNTSTNQYNSSGTYNKYVFDSNNGTDNVYFTNYGSADFTVNYANNSHKVKDALSGFGGTSDGYGFFPFDNSSGSQDTYGYDYGFGMRLDIPFNIGADGYIENSREPMMFNFSGDDDVWVFIDGQLALDLGGDHKKAQGWINFATKEAVITSGVYKPGEYGSNEYSNPLPSETTNYNLSWTSYTDNGNTYYKTDLSNLLKYSDSNSTWSDPTQSHTLSVFYMERGLSESNLKFEFTMSPLQNQLTLDKEINVGDVNNSLQAKTKEYAANDTFNYEVKVNGAANWNTSYSGTSNRPVYTDLNDGSATTLGTDGIVSGIKDGKGFKFLKQIKDDNRPITITEQIPATGNLYSYTPESMTAKDVTNSNSSIGTTSADNKTINFGFKTASTNQGAVTNIAVHNVNKVDTGSVTIKKKYEPQDNQSFQFTVRVQLPGSSEWIAVKSSFGVASNGDGVTITGIPINSKVRVNENGALSRYNAAYKVTQGGVEDNTAVVGDSGYQVDFTLTNSSATVECTNTDKVYTKDVTIPAAKTINGSVPSAVAVPESTSKDFKFDLYELTVNGTTATKGNSVGTLTYNQSTGAISIKVENLTIGTTYYYLLSEDSTGMSYYNCDTSEYWVEVTPGSSSNTINFFKTSKSGSTYTKGDAVTGNSVTFNNVIKGSITVVKDSTNDRLSAFDGTVFAIVKADPADSTKPDSSAAVTTATVDAGKDSVTFENLDIGKYVVYEVKSPNGHELKGEYIPVEVTTLHKDVSTTIINDESTKLPETGGIGVVIMIVAGAALIALGIYLLKPVKKKDDSASEGKAK